MTGNDEGDRVCGASSGHCPGGSRLAERSRDLLIRSGLSPGNLLQRPPDFLLEGRRLDIEREARSIVGSSQGSENGTDFVPEAIAVPAKPRVREVCPERGQ